MIPPLPLEHDDGQEPSVEGLVLDGARPAVIADRPRVTRDRRERGDPHDPTVAEVRLLRPAEVHNSPPGRRAPARDAALRHATPIDFATGKERLPAARALPPSRSSPPPSAPPPEPAALRTVGLKQRSREGAAATTDAVEARMSPRVPGGPAFGASQSAPEAPRAVPGAPRRLGVPVPVRVQFGAGGRPVRIEGAAVGAVRESWLIEDRWWTARPLRRRYWEVVTTAGHNSIVFRDLVDGRWYRQR